MVIISCLFVCIEFLFYVMMLWVWVKYLVCIYLDVIEQFFMLVFEFFFVQQGMLRFIVLRRKQLCGFWLFFGMIFFEGVRCVDILFFVDGVDCGLIWFIVEIVLVGGFVL